MGQAEVMALFQRIAAMVAGVEQATGAMLNVLVENGVIDRDVLVKGLLAKRDALDPKFSQGGFDNLIAALKPATAPGQH